MGSLGQAGNLAMLKSSKTGSPSLWLQSVGCWVISCQQRWWWWLTGLTRTGLEGIERASGPQLRCNHNHDHVKSSHASLMIHTLSYGTRTRHLLVSPGYEMAQKFIISLGSAAPPALRLLSQGAVIWLLNQEGYGVAAKNCYSWGQILYFCKQAQTWPTSNKLQRWLIGSLFFKKCGLVYIPRMLSPFQFWLRRKCKTSHLPQGPVFTSTSQPHQYTKPSGGMIHFRLAPSSPPICSAHAFRWWDHAELKSLDIKP